MWPYQMEHQELDEPNPAPWKFCVITALSGQWPSDFFTNRRHKNATSSQLMRHEITAVMVGLNSLVQSLKEQPTANETAWITQWAWPGHWTHLDPAPAALRAGRRGGRPPPARPPPRHRSVGGPGHSTQRWRGRPRQTGTSPSTSSSSSHLQARPAGPGCISQATLEVAVEPPKALAQGPPRWCSLLRPTSRLPRSGPLLPGSSQALLRELHLLTPRPFSADALRKLKQVNHLVGLLRRRWRTSWRATPRRWWWSWAAATRTWASSSTSCS